MFSVLERDEIVIKVSPTDKYGNPVKGQERVWFANGMNIEDATTQAISETRDDIKKCKPHLPLFVTRSSVSVNKK